MPHAHKVSKPWCVHTNARIVALWNSYMREYHDFDMMQQCEEYRKRQKVHTLPQISNLFVTWHRSNFILQLWPRHIRHPAVLSAYLPCLALAPITVKMFKRLEFFRGIHPACQAVIRASRLNMFQLNVLHHCRLNRLYFMFRWVRLASHCIWQVRDVFVHCWTGRTVGYMFLLVLVYFHFPKKMFIRLNSFFTLWLLKN